MSGPRSSHIIDDFEQRRLNELRKVAEAGSELAPAAALFFCATHGVSVPEWLVDLAARGYCKQLDSSRPKKRGRSSEPLDRYRQDLIDLMRWDAVRYARYKQKELSEREEIIESFSDLPAGYKDEHRKMFAWFGHGWLRAYECASMMLGETPAFGGADAMRVGYCRVELRTKKYSKLSWRYCYFEPEFLESVGIVHPSRWPQSTKFTPLYELTF